MTMQTVAAGYIDSVKGMIASKFSIFLEERLHLAMDQDFLASELNNCMY